MNIGGFAASRLASLALVVGAMGSLVWAGCGNGNGRYYCDNSGCYQCDGYGCHTVGPAPGVDAGPGADVGIPVNDTGAATYAPEASTPVDASDGGVPEATASEAGDSSGPQTCTDAASCPTGTTCASGVCTACGGGNEPLCACTTSTQCTGSSQECWQNQCITCGGTNGPCPCASNTDCSGGNVCAGGVCTPPSDACTYSSDCADGKVCANGQCVASCPTTPCGAGTTCTGGACLPSATGCTSSATCSAPTPYCVEGACTASCSASGQCATGEYCNQGACVTDTRPTTECATSSTCDTNQTCVDGYCLYTCTSNMQCALIDARIAFCSTDGYCRDQTEANPQCTQQSQCAAGQNCISNTCM